jgi:glycosyltransferase involved in cell wall biosynthesis
VAAIDVILPVRNGMPFVIEAMDSIRNQTFSDWRLLVLDHGSTDSSLEAVRQYAESDNRIAVYSCPQADSIGSLRNIGLSLCDCRYVMLQDADDISFPDRMEKVVDAFGNVPDLLAVGGEAIVIDPKGRTTGHLPVLENPAAISAAAIFNFPMIHPASAFNLPAVNRLGGAYGRDFLNMVPASDSITVNKLAEDYIMFGQLALAGKCMNLRHPLIKYRRHAGSVGVASQAAQIDVSLAISRFLAKSFSFMYGTKAFDPAPFCNHGDYVFDDYSSDYSEQFAVMAAALQRGFGPSPDLRRELAFREVMATRQLAVMAYRFAKFRSRHASLPSERRTVRNWLLKNLRHDKYVYRPGSQPVGKFGYAQ